MGKQTLVAMTEVDEAKFLNFLRETADIEILIGFAPTKEGLVVPQFGPRQPGQWVYYIWNKQFPWEKEYGCVRDDISNIDHRGWMYVKDKGKAPLIEYMRHNFQTNAGHAYGRIYWSKPFNVGKGEQSYDFEVFSKWYARVVVG